MIDKIQQFLIAHCKLQFWVRKQINKPNVLVDKINTNSISSVK